MRMFLFFILVLSFFPRCAGADEKKGDVYSVLDDVKIVTTEGKAVMGEDMTVSQAKAVALNHARRSALEKAVGVNLHSNTILYNGELISDLINSATKGLIVKEKIEDGCGEESGRLYCYARIEAHVKPLKGQSAPKIKFLKYSVQRPDNDAAVNNPVFQSNDEIQVKVALNEDSYLNVFSVDQYGNITKLFPNEYVKSEPVPARKAFVFPDDSLRARGLKIRVETPKKLSKATETVLIVATKEKGHFLEDHLIDNPTITDLMKELSELDQSQWAEKSIGYEVRR